MGLFFDISSSNSNYPKSWWKNNESLLKWFPQDKRLEIFENIPYQNNEKYIFNGAGFQNKINTKWTSKGEERREIILFAPHYRRQLLPNEILIDIDSENIDHALKRAVLIDKVLTCLEIPSMKTFSGSKGFHFHITIDTSTPLPEDMQTAITMSNGAAHLKQCIFEKIIELAGSDSIDHAANNIGQKRRASQELYSINAKSNCYNLPLEEIKIEKIKCNTEPPNRNIIYPKWSIKDDDWNWINRISAKLNDNARLQKKSMQITNDFYDLNNNFEKRNNNPTNHNQTNDKNNNSNDWKHNRIAIYTKEFMRTKRLVTDQKISERHSGNEHNARVHLLMLCIELNYSDKQIHDIFRNADDYKEDITQYFITYNRERCKSETK
jgi:hypothetical protein